LLLLLLVCSSPVPHVQRFSSRILVCCFFLVLITNLLVSSLSLCVIYLIGLSFLEQIQGLHWRKKIQRKKVSEAATKILFCCCCCFAALHTSSSDWFVFSFLLFVTRIQFSLFLFILFVIFLFGFRFLEQMMRGLHWQKKENNTCGRKTRRNALLSNGVVHPLSSATGFVWNFRRTTFSSTVGCI
jgi:hypothetical protein